MAKSKFFRVALEGATTDGRTIDRQLLADMAATYNRDTYAARVNLEHIRGITPDGPFQSYGDVLALKTEEVTIDLAGKQEKRLALFAEIDALDPLVAMNKKGQKLYSSVEIAPNFANSGKAYLVGLAVTDSPASLGTEMLKFAATQGENSPLATRKQDKANLFSAADEANIELIAEAAPELPAEQKSMFSSITALVEKLTGKVEEKPKVEEAKPAAVPDLSEFAATFGQLASAVQKLATDVSGINTRLTSLAAENATLKATIENTPRQHSQRPAADGGKFTATDC